MSNNRKINKEIVVYIHDQTAKRKDKIMLLIVFVCLLKASMRTILGPLVTDFRLPSEVGGRMHEGIDAM